ncbi:hypothetical protein [Pseudomonas sp. R5(2019)]|uniref:hypothetical protein n=1 Tax=Pseudomonas sp. R5(2019) TaxID=2697566 RepID=UPI001412021C|nr:hypothetical protein [Pseudomonas sp. R5(2019)]NBA98241.1 hypothetical protein [Pseudomonas sp. R5(2019)]
MTLAQLALYGGITVMLPAALVIAVWVWYSGSRAAVALWGLIFFVAYAVVGGSKILFKGWGIGIEPLDIAVISGHAMNTTLMTTVLLSLLAQQIKPRFRWPAALAGLGVSWWFAIMCVAPFIHPVSEAIAGAAVGSVGAGGFVYLLGRLKTRRISPGILAVGVVFIGLNTMTSKYTAEHALDRVAMMLSGQEKAFKQPKWRVEGDRS